MALRVPRATEQGLGDRVAPVSGGRVAVTASPAAFGAVQARQLAQASAALEQAARAGEAIKRSYDATVIADLQAQWRDRTRQLLDDPQSGLLTRRGRDAGGITQEFERRLTELQPEFADRLQDAEQRRQFDRLVQQHAIALRDVVARHERAEFQRYQAEAHEAARRAAMEDAARFAGDPQAQAEAMSFGEGVIRVSMAGSPPEAVEQAVREFRAGVHALALERMLADENVDGAAQYLEAHSQDMRLQDLSRYRQAIRAERRRREAEARAAALSRLLPRLEDDPARAASGVLVREPLSLRDFMAAFPPDEARRRYEDYRKALSHGELLSRVAGAEPEELQQLLKQAAPDPESEGYADALKRYEELRRAVAEEWRSRLDDPVDHVLRVNRTVAGLYAQAQEDPQRLQTALESALAEQKRLGVPEQRRRLLPVRVAKDIVERVRSAETAQQKLEALLPVAVGAGRLGDRVLDELVREGLPTGYGLAVRAARDGDMDRARRLAGLVETDVRLTSDERTDLEWRIARTPVAAELQRLGLLAESTGDPTVLARATELSTLTQKAAAARMREGASAPTAVADAVKLVLGRQQPFADPDIGAVTLPEGITPDMAEPALKRMREHALSIPVDPALLEELAKAFPDDPEPVVRRKVETVLADMKEAARWVDTGDGQWVLVVPVPTETGVVWRRWSDTAATPADLIAILLQEQQ